MSQSSVAGGFGNRVLERIVANDTFVQAEVREVVISQRVEYYSGSVGRGPKHTGKLSVVERWDNDDARDVRTVGVDPSVFLRIYVKPLNKRMLVCMSPSDIVQFGEFSSLRGRFELTVDSVEVKVNSESVTFENYGTYTWEKEVSDTITYSSFRTKRRRIFDRGYQCGEEMEEQLRSAWAKKEGVHSGIWRVSDVDDPEYSSTVELEVESEATSDCLSFFLSMDEWDENAELRELIEKDGNGLPSNLDGEDVYVSFSEMDGAIAECDGWFLYRANGVGSIKRRIHSVFA